MQQQFVSDRVEMAHTALLLLLPVTSGFNALSRRPASPAAPIICHAAPRLACHATPLRLASTVETRPAIAPENYAGIPGGPTGPRIRHVAGTLHAAGPRVDLDVSNRPAWTTAGNDRWLPSYGELSPNTTRFSRRNLLRSALWATGMYYGSGRIASASAYTVSKKEPDETETYAEAQKGDGPLRVLWVGSEDMKGVFKSLFPAGNDVIALDLRRPDAKALNAATTYATEHGYQLRFEQGDATKLNFTDGSFDVVVSSMFLCQDFDPEVVVGEIRRVLKPGGRFGFYEHVEDIDKIIVGKVFGERSVIQVQAYPEMINVSAGVVRKV